MIISLNRIKHEYKINKIKNQTLLSGLENKDWYSRFMLFYVNKKNQKMFNEVFKKYKKANFSLDNTSSKYLILTN